jgi:hypothetical protein
MNVSHQIKQWRKKISSIHYMYTYLYFCCWFFHRLVTINRREWIFLLNQNKSLHSDRSPCYGIACNLEEFDELGKQVFLTFSIQKEIFLFSCWKSRNSNEFRKKKIWMISYPNTRTLCGVVKIIITANIQLNCSYW